MHPGRRFSGRRPYEDASPILSKQRDDSNSEHCETGASDGWNAKTLRHPAQAGTIDAPTRADKRMSRPPTPIEPASVICQQVRSAEFDNITLADCSSTSSADYNLSPYVGLIKPRRGSDMIFDARELKLYMVKKRINKIIFVIKSLKEHAKLVNIVYRDRNVPSMCFLGVNARKYLDEYMALNLDTRTRRQVIYSHHEWMRDFTALSVKDTAVLWKNLNDDQSIVLRKSSLAPLEGELELVFQVRDFTICTLSFVVCRGDLVGIGENLTLIIGGLQGRPNTASILREISKSNREISPADMLFLACKAFAVEAGIKQIVGYSAEFNSASSHSTLVTMDYGGFWAANSAIAGNEGQYLLDPSLEKDPSDPVTSGNSSRTRRKRRDRILFKEQVMENISRARILAARMNDNSQMVSNPERSLPRSMQHSAHR